MGSSPIVSTQTQRCSPLDISPAANGVVRFVDSHGLAHRIKANGHDLGSVEEITSCRMFHIHGELASDL